MTANLTETQTFLLKWLGESDVSQYGECHGKDLDALIADGLAQVHGPESGLTSGFIARGTEQMYRAVSLTDKGIFVLREQT